MEPFLDHPWAVWITIAIVFGIIEMTVPSFTCIFAVFSALVAALVSLRYGLPAQIGAFAAALVCSVIFLRPFLLSRFSHEKASMPSRSEALVGLRGAVTVAIDPVSGEGRVLVEGTDWAAKSDHAIEAGVSIVVIGKDGISLKVKES